MYMGPKSTMGIPLSSNGFPLSNLTSSYSAITAKDLVSKNSRSTFDSIAWNSWICSSDSSGSNADRKSVPSSMPFNFLSAKASVEMNKERVPSCPEDRSIAPLFGIPDWKLSATVG